MVMTLVVRMTTTVKSKLKRMVKRYDMGMAHVLGMMDLSMMVGGKKEFFMEREFLLMWMEKNKMASLKEELWTKTTRIKIEKKQLLNQSKQNKSQKLKKNYHQ